MRAKAVRRRRAKESRDRSSFKFPVFSKFLSSCLLKLRWYKILLMVAWYEIRLDAAIKSQCNKGFHKLVRNRTSVTYNKKTVRVDYLECGICREYKFFATAEDKRKYIAMTGRNRKRWGALFK